MKVYPTIGKLLPTIGKPLLKTLHAAHLVDLAFFLLAPDIAQLERTA